MFWSRRTKETPEPKRLCILARELNNRLAVIAGHCEMLAEHAEADSECAKRVSLILEAVYSMAKRINGHDCRMNACAAQNPDFKTQQDRTYEKHC